MCEEKITPEKAEENRKRIQEAAKNIFQSKEDENDGWVKDEVNGGWRRK